MLSDGAEYYSQCLCLMKQATMLPKFHVFRLREEFAPEIYQASSSLRLLSCGGLFGLALSFSPSKVVVEVMHIQRPIETPC